MEGWILYRKPDTHISADVYEMNRFQESAKANGINLRIIPPEDFEITVFPEERKKVIINGEVTPLPDFIIPRMGAGTTYFALAVIRQLEKLGVYSLNSSVAVESVKDKLYTQQILAQENIPMPQTMMVKFPVDVDLVTKHFKYPLILKTLYGAQGKGVFMPRSHDEFLKMLELVEIMNNEASLIIQEMITPSFGRDLRVFTVGGRVVACMERSAADPGGFKANFSQGGKVRDFPVDDEIEWLATTISRLFELDVAGVDLLFDDDGYKVCEVNSSPGFRGIESVCPARIPDEIFHYIKVRLGHFGK
ncbi:RimK family alpha-L-glutamate ligase [Myxococcota bacterium]|nr:RimK family alpha-L-glutamate ligase [Myxococcota bacterium]